MSHLQNAMRTSDIKGQKERTVHNFTRLYSDSIYSFFHPKSIRDLLHVRHCATHWGCRFIKLILPQETHVLLVGVSVRSIEI